VSLPLLLSGIQVEAGSSAKVPALVLTGNVTATCRQTTLLCPRTTIQHTCHCNTSDVSSRTCPRPRGASKTKSNVLVLRSQVLACSLCNFRTPLFSTTVETNTTSLSTISLDQIGLKAYNSVFQSFCCSGTPHKHENHLRNRMHWSISLVTYVTLKLQGVMDSFP